MPLSRRIAATVLALLLAGPAAARDLAAEAEAALQAGAPDVALRLAGEAAAERPGDPRLLVLLGRAQIAAGRPDLARQTARAAWRATKGAPDLRFDAARLGARAAADERRYGAARLWLRLAADNARDGPRRAAVAESMATLRRLDPTSTRLSFAVTPSSNINGGSSADRLVVDGILTPLIFSGDARALSGIEARVDMIHSWRIAEGPRGTTVAALRFSGATYALSGDAQAQAPDIAGSDFATAVTEVSLRRIAPQAAGQLQYGVALGRTWYGGDPQSVLLRFDLSRARVLSRRLTFDLGAAVEGRVADRDDAESVALSLRGGLARQFARGTLESDLTLTRVWSDDRPSEAYRGAAIALSWAPRPRGRPVEMIFTMSSSVRQYDSFLGNVFGDSDRTDWRVALDARLSFPNAERFGFVPTVTVNGSRTWSNVSRFDGDELGVSFGLSSSF